MSSVHCFDVQVWSNIFCFLNVTHLEQLILAGDHKVSKECIEAIRCLSVTCLPLECFVLSRAIVENIKSLSITTWMVRGNVERILDWVAKSRLEKLSLHTILGAFHLVLPSTLRKLRITGHIIGDYPLVMGDVKLSHLKIDIDPANLPEVAQNYVELLVMSSVETLESLSLGYDTPTAQDMSGHKRLSRFETDLPYFAVNQYKPPPAVHHLTVKTVCCHLYSIESTLPFFGSSIVHLTIDGKLLGISCLDISHHGHIRVLTIYSLAKVLCAPNNHLDIICQFPPRNIINRGKGTVSIQSEHIAFRMGNLLEPAIIQMLSWSHLRHLHFEYHEYAPMTFIDTDNSVLSMAVNVKSLFINSDTYGYYANRDGAKFFALFPKLQVLHWSMTFDLCRQISASRFCFPPSVTDLAITITDNTLLNPFGAAALFDSMKHVPQKMVLSGLPFMPCIISLCNRSPSPLQLEYKCSMASYDPETWEEDNIPTFVPSRHVRSATFEFGPQWRGKSLLNRIFGLLYHDDICAAIYCAP